jgi:MbtH protein
MSNPFDDDESIFHVLVNDEGQHSLWPATLAIPAGWTIVMSDGRKADCLCYVEATWTDMRPRSLADAMPDRSAVEGR